MSQKNEAKKKHLHAKTRAIHEIFEAKIMEANRICTENKRESG